MRYLGGKFRIARHINAAINSRRPEGVVLWDAFCGGLAIAGTVGGRVWASDVNACLIHMYQAVQRGWDPPDRLTPEQYQAARHLPDTDPMKAFVGFGCSFAGKWFGGYAKPKVVGGRSYTEANSTRNSLKKLVPKVERFAAMSFMRPAPGPADLVIYCDPPYAGTTGYTTGFFDYGAFLQRVEDWARWVPVFVSEYSLPIGREVWAASAVNGSACLAKKPEKLFLVGG